ncbi:MAG: hypothetical protein HC836_25590 [Richelia sp. RM2_1_2]|nr:hypothetical protein [Richelia sp. RM2_1_2]
MAHVPETGKVTPIPQDKIDRTTRWIIHMFSGGVDCVAALYILLTDEKYQQHNICVHHIHLENCQNRSLAEKRACGQLIPWFTDSFPTRTIIYNESTWSYPFEFTQGCPYDTLIVGAQAANIVNGFNYNGFWYQHIDHVANGQTLDDIHNPGANLRMAGREQIYFDMLRFTGARPNYPTWLYPTAKYTKQELINMIPADLLRLCWSCRTPIDNYTACGQCHACVSLYKCGVDPRTMTKNV